MDLHVLNEGQPNDYKYYAMPYPRIKSREGEKMNIMKYPFKWRGKKEFELEKIMNAMEDDYRWHVSAWIIFPFSHFYRKVEDFILRCHENGIIEYWTDVLHRDKSIHEEEEPKVLTFYMLSAGFYLWLGCLGVTCCVFIGELISFYVVKQFQVVLKRKTQGLPKIIYVEERE